MKAWFFYTPDLDPQEWTEAQDMRDSLHRVKHLWIKVISTEQIEVWINKKPSDDTTFMWVFQLK